MPLGAGFMGCKAMGRSNFSWHPVWGGLKGKQEEHRQASGPMLTQPHLGGVFDPQMGLRGIQREPRDSVVFVDMKTECQEAQLR